MQKNEKDQKGLCGIAEKAVPLHRIPIVEYITI